MSLPNGRSARPSPFALRQAQSAQGTQDACLSSSTERKMLTSNGISTNFHSSGLRQKIDQLMDILWAGGVNNPMDSIEQLSYLLFLRLLSERDEKLAILNKKYTR